MVYNFEMDLRQSVFTQIQVVDSHTAGEPTRSSLPAVRTWVPAISSKSFTILRTRYDALRAATIGEPRGSDVIVGALLCEPADPSSAAAVIFFNQVGYLGMCGHGTIGLVTTLKYLGRIAPGKHRIETPVGPVLTQLHLDGSVSFENVPSYRYRAQVAVDVPGYGSFCGDIAWGGNWFFLVSDHNLELDASNRAELMQVSTAIRTALASGGITGKNNEPIEHVEFFRRDPGNSARNFVLCPGTAFDRSPCGTGTSAKFGLSLRGGQTGTEHALASGRDFRYGL